VSWEPRDLSSPVYAVDPEPTHPDYSGLWYDGKRHYVSAPTESIKTLFVMAIGLNAIRAGRTIAVIDFEMGPQATRRLLVDLGATDDELATVYYVQPEAAPTPADLDTIIDANIDLVVIDAAPGAYDVSGLDDNARKDAEKFARQWITRLWKADVTTVVVDHVTKAAEGRGKYAIGSERKVGQVDVHLGLEVVGTPLTRGGLAWSRSASTKTAAGFLHRPYAAEIALVSDPTTHRITWEIRPAAAANPTTGWQPTILMDRALAFLEQQTEPVSRTTVAAGIGKNKQQALRAIDILISNGDVHESPGPRNAKLLTSTRTAVPEQFQKGGPR
jgi:hypothetical protein